MGSAMDPNSFIERSRREAARWRVAHRQIGQGVLRLHGLLLVPAITRRRARCLSVVCQPGFTARIEMTENNDRAPLFGNWRRAYWVALGLFALEVALLYAFT